MTWALQQPDSDDYLTEDLSNTIIATLLSHGQVRAALEVVSTVTSIETDLLISVYLSNG